MPIPANQITHCEIQVFGEASSAGSSAKRFDFTFHYRRTAVVLPLVKGDIDTAFQAAIVVPLGAALNNRYTQTRNTVRFINDALDAPTDFSHAVVGAVAGDSMAVACAAYFLLKTGLRGKSYRGGKHFGPMSEADTTAATADIFNAAALARFATLSAAMLTGFTDAGGNIWIPSVLSRKKSKLKTNPTTVVANDVVSILPNKRVGWMRHRRVESVY